MDREDPLASFRNEFELADGLVYLDGNSLGAMPKAAAERASEVVHQEWGKDLIESWNKAGWFQMPEVLGDKIAQLIGAEPGEVVVTDSTGINLYKVLYAALSLNRSRDVIVMEGSNFPTDNYVVQGLVEQMGDQYQLKFVEEDEIFDALSDEVAVLCLTQVHYKSGRVLDMQAITAAAQAQSIVVIWDLCHSAGAFEVDLNGCNADLAIGCTYKYLNGGPGSPAFIFLAQRHHGKALQPLTGWWGHAAPFAFERDYRPAEGILQMRSGTQPILSLAVAEVGLDMFLRADMRQIREKSQRLTSLFIQLVEGRCGEDGFELVSPRDAEARGSQVSFDHENGYAIVQALIAAGVVGDFRAPSNMRFGFTPLYIRYVDVWDAVDRLHEIMRSGLWQEQRFHQRGAVT
ncbi:MAG: kynureninase [Gammaproteobacteria bacterium]|nr:kynureninase [Gammaproteobacteria bacterium]